MVNVLQKGYPTSILRTHTISFNLPPMLAQTFDQWQPSLYKSANERSESDFKRLETDLVTFWRPWRHPSGLRKLLTGALKPLGLLELLVLVGLFALLLGLFKVLLEQVGNAALLLGGLDGFRKLRQNYNILKTFFFFKYFIIYKYTF